MAEGQEALNRFAIGVQVQGQQLAGLKKQIQEINSMSAKGGSAGGTRGTKNIDKTQKSLNRLNSTYAKGTKTINAYNKQFVAAARSNKNEMADMFKRVALWSSGIAVLFGAIGKIRKVFQATQELEVSMAELKKVMDDNTPFHEVKKNLFIAGKAFSITIDKVAEVSKIWAQQGKNHVQVANLTTTALLGVNSANLTASQSVEFLTAVTKAYNVEAERTSRIMDGIMSVQADYAITASNLAKGFMRVGQTASVMGDDLGTVFGMITAIGEVSREAGNVIGQSLKTQFARIVRPETLKYLESLGIATRRLTGEKLPARSLFEQISQKIQSGEFDAETQINLSLKLGGIRKFKDALILMNRWITAEEARAKFLLAYDDAQKASKITQETLTKQVDKLGVVFTELGTTVIEQNVIPALRGLVGFFTEMFGSINSFIAKDPTGLASGIFPSAVLGIAGMGILRNLGKSMMGETLRGFEQGIMMTGMPVSQGYGTDVERAMGLNQLSRGERATYKKYTRVKMRDLQSQLKLTKASGASASLGQKALLANNALYASQIALAGNAEKAAGAMSKSFYRTKLLLRGITAGAMPTAFMGAGAKVDKSGLGAIRMASIGAGIGRTVAGVAKMGLMIGAIDLAMRGFGHVWEKYQTIDINLSDTIDITSEASKSFIALYETIDKTKSGVKDFGKEMTDYEKAIELMKPTQKIADLIDKKQITNLVELKKALNDSGFAVKNFKEAVDVQMSMYKFIRHEILKREDELRGRLLGMKTEILKGVTFDLDEIIQFDSRAPKFGVLQDIVRETDDLWNALVNVLKTRDKTMAFPPSRPSGDEVTTTDLTTTLEKILNEFKKAGKTGSWKVGGVYGEHMLFDEALKIIQKHDPTAIDEALIQLYEKEIRDKADLPKEKMDKALDIEGKVKEKEILNKTRLANNYDKAVQRIINDTLKEDSLYQGYLSDVINLRKMFKDSWEGFIRTISSVSSALAKMKDHVFIAMNNLAKGFQIADIKEGLKKQLGVGFNINEKKLELIRSYITDLTEIEPGLEAKIRGLKQNISILEKLKDRASDIVTIKIEKQLEGSGIALEKYGSITKDQLANVEAAGASAGDASMAAFVQEWVRAASDKIRIEEEIKLMKGKIAQGLEGMKFLEGVFEDLGIELKEIDQRKLATFRDKIAGELLKSLNKLTGSVTEDVFQDAMREFRVQNIQKIGRLGVEYTELFATTNAYIDNERKFAAQISAVRNDYNAQIGKLLTEKDLLTKSGDTTEALDAKIKELQVEKEVALELERYNKLMEDQRIALDKSRGALTNFKDAIAAFLADVNTFKFDTREGFTQGINQYLGNILGNYAQNVNRQAIEGLIEGNELGLGALLAGVKKPEQIALDNNTTGLSGNTLSINNLTRTIDALIIAQGGTALDLVDVSKGFTESAAGIDNMSNAMAERKKKTDTASVDYIAQLMNMGGMMGGNILGNMLAQGSGKSNEWVGIGSQGLSMLMQNLFPGGGLVGGILGGLFGSLFGSDTDEKDSKNLERIADNTAALVDVDSRLINAPADFKLPALAKVGGSINYSGGITINITGSNDPVTTGREVARALGGGVSNYNSVGGI